MKCLTLPGLTSVVSKIFEKLKSNIKLAEESYTWVAPATQANSTFSVPNYNNASDTLDVYKNGFKLIETRDYTINGQNVVLIKEMNVGDTFHFVCRRISLTF